MTSLKISLAQMDIALGQPAQNLEKVQQFAAEAAAQGSDLLVLPELWSTGYDLANADKHATDTQSGIFAAVGEIAQQHNLHIIGSCLSNLNGGYGNTIVFHNGRGETLAEYSKIHLFRLMDEDQYLTAGDEAVIAGTAWGEMGLTICYDLRFPELFRRYALAGAKLIFVPAEWPHPRLMHWRTLLRARAIENQLFIVACNRVGIVGKTHFCGHSAVIDPWGETLVEGDETEGLLTTEIDLSLVNEVRQRIPIFADRRPEIYEAPLTMPLR